MGVVGGSFVPLLVRDQGERCGVIEHRLREHHPQEQAYLHRAQANRLGREQRLVVLQAEQRVGGVQPNCPQRLVQGTE